jgi:arabinose-5-phosphate isomerase
LLRILPAIKKIGAKIVALTAQEASTLAAEADIVLHIPIEKEACPLDLAPTVSTTVALAIGDALAIVLMTMKNFQSEDFARYHPGGKLGKRLLRKISDVMVPRKKCPVLSPETAVVQDVILSLCESGLGAVLFSNADDRLEGILTDGDIRRLLNEHRSAIFDLNLQQVINRNPLTLGPELKAVEALRFMEARPKPLNLVPVTQEGKILGIVRIHDLLG